MEKKEFNIYPYWKNKQVKLKVQLTYESNQVLRFTVLGNSSIEVETDYPLLISTNKRRKMMWKLKSGSVPDETLLRDIFSRIETVVKNDGRNAYSYSDYPQPGK